MAKNRKCISCGEKYSYCPGCSRVAALEPVWKSEFCSEDCMTLWMTLTRYNMNRLTKQDAKEIISSLNLKPIDVYASCVQRDYAKVMHEENKPRKIKKPEFVFTPVEPAFEAIVEQPIEVAEPVAIEPVHEVVLEEKE
jgi:hypothetical protein